MHIYIDESGSFARPSTPHRVSCVAALLIPETFSVTLYRKFRNLVLPWCRQRREVKGSDLTESQMAEVLGLLRRFDVVAIADCIDMGMHTDDTVQIHKAGQADAIDRSAGRLRDPNLARTLRELASRVRALSNQLYVQSVVLTEVVDRVIRHGPLYYAQRIPSTLGAFRWRVDAKGRDITPSERLWRDIVQSIMQTMSLKAPTPAMIGADYSAFAPFIGVLPEPPGHLWDHLPPDERTSPFHFIDLNRIMADLRFRRSHHLAGLQLADIVASAITRACNGTMQRSGWEGVCRIMLQNERGKHAVRFISLLTEERSPRVPYSAVVRTCDEKAKMIVAGIARTGRRR